MRAWWGALTLALTGCVYNTWHPESARELGQLVPEAQRVYDADLQALRDANGHKVGSIDSTGDRFADFDRIAAKAAKDGAEYGGTHFYIAKTDLNWSAVQRPGQANTTCERDGQQVNCATSYTQPTTTYYSNPHAWIIVIRVERADWPSLPAHLQPRPAAR